MPSRRGRSRGPARFQDELEAALAGPQPSPEFRSRLREQLMAGHPGAQPALPSVDQLAKRRVRHMSRRGRSSGPRRAGLLVAAIALVVMSAGYLWLREPMAQLGALPAPGAGLEPVLSGAGGPGIQFSLQYRLGGPLAAGWPALPGRQLAHKVRPMPFTRARAETIAGRLGITAPVVQEGWQDGYLWAADPGDGGPSLRVFPHGYVYFSQPYEFRPRGREELPSREAAITAARNWLVASGIAGANLGPATVTEDLAIGVLRVWFRPAEPADVVTHAPWAQVELGSEARVVTGSAVWFDLEASSQYPLRSVAEAWAEVRDGKGMLSWAAMEWTGPIGEDNVVRGTMTVDGVRLAWSLGRGADGAYFLVPAYVFAGEIEVAGEAGPVRVPATVWAAAVTARHLGR